MDRPRRHRRARVVIEAYPDYLTLPEGVRAEAAIADVSRNFEKLGADAGGQALAHEARIQRIAGHQNPE